MTTFDKREQDFEAKVAHDEELMFKPTARTNKLLGLWAAGQLGLGGDAAAAYATALTDDFRFQPHSARLRMPESLSLST